MPALPTAVRIGLRLARAAGPLLASGPVQRLLKGRVARGAPGPSAAARAAAETRLWAEARDDAGGLVRTRLRTPEAYELTSWTAVELAARALRGELPPDSRPRRALAAQTSSWRFLEPSERTSIERPHAGRVNGSPDEN